MMKSQGLIFGLLCLLCLSAFGYFISHASAELKDYRLLRDQESQLLNFNNRILKIESWLNRSDDLQPNVIEAKKVKSQYQAALKSAQTWSYYAALPVLLLIFAGVWKFFHWRIRILSFIIGGLACLAAGLFLPLLEIGALLRDLTISLDTEGAGILAMALGKSKSFPGDIYFYYQSKSILEIIQILFEQKNLIVGISIFCFSLLIPVVKLLSSAVMLIRIKSPGLSKIQKFILSLGKWSMADVFVAAVFLSSLAFNNMNPGVQTISNVLPGIYFFLAYCLLSILSSVLLSRKLRAE